MKDFIPKAGDFFVDLSETYESVMMLQCFEEKGSKVLYAYGNKGQGDDKESIRVNKPLTEFTGPFFPSFRLRRDITGLEEKCKVYKRIRIAIEEYLLNQHNYSALVGKVTDHLLTKGETLENCEIIIRTLVGEYIEYWFKKLKSGDHLRFSNLKANAERGKEYYGSLAKEIRVKSDKISLLVSHDQTAGNYRELILRELLKKFVPSKFSVASGFIEDVPKQMDIIIYDSHNYYPTFKEGDLVVVRREAVRAIIEVKTELNSTTLNESLESFFDILRAGIYKPEIPLFKGIFAFNTEYVDANTIAKNVKAFYNEPYFLKSLGQNVTNEIQYLHHEITGICVLHKHFLYSQYFHAEDKNSNIVPHLFSVSEERGIDIQTTMFLVLLFSYLDIDYGAKRSMVNGFSKVYAADTARVNLEEKLTPDDWFPRTMSKNEHDGTQTKIKERLDKINSWFNGETTTTDYLRDLHRE